MSATASDYMDAIIPALLSGAFVSFWVFVWIFGSGINDRQMVKVVANGWTWCGQQKHVHYKPGFISIDVPKGTESYYGTIRIAPVDNCDEEKK